MDKETPILELHTNNDYDIVVSRLIAAYNQMAEHHDFYIDCEVEPPDELIWALQYAWKAKCLYEAYLIRNEEET